MYQTPVKVFNKYIDNEGPLKCSGDKEIDMGEPTMALGGSPDMRLPGLMRSKQSVFDRFSDKHDLIREVQSLRTQQ